jgi:isocitrate dehydrogenase
VPTFNFGFIIWGMFTPIPANHLIRIQNGKLVVPDKPVIPFIEGEGSGPDLWRAARRVLDAAVSIAYPNRRQVVWSEVLAGQKAFDRTGTWLPEATLAAFKGCLVGIKGPLTTPVGEGMRSLNVALRKALDLYVCLRPVRWFQGVPSPMRHPERVDMVVFRENTEDLYAGIEFQSGGEGAAKLLDFLQTGFPQDYQRIRFPQSSGFSLKPISKEGSERLVRAAIRWALANQRRSVTLVHKGNVMKHTEGAFRSWGYGVAENEFASQVYTGLQWERTRKERGEEAANTEQAQARQAGRLLVNDIITDAAFEAVITRPQEYDVLATTNLNGDYLSDALAALVGGLGIAPGANINYESGAAVFEATHGTAERLAGKDAANPTSLILSGEMLLRYMGWDEAAELIVKAIASTIEAGNLTADLAAHTENTPGLSTTQYGDALIQAMQSAV